MFITGRTSRVVDRFDCKISIDSVEEKIRSNIHVTDCAIISIPELNKDMIAFVSLKEDIDGNTLDLVNMIQEGNQPLSEIEIPMEIHCLSQMPYLGSGKIDYKALEELYVAKA